MTYPNIAYRRLTKVKITIRSATTSIEKLKWKLSLMDIKATVAIQLQDTVIILFCYLNTLLISLEMDIKVMVAV